MALSEAARIWRKRAIVRRSQVAEEIFAIAQNGTALLLTGQPVPSSSTANTACPTNRNYYSIDEFTAPGRLRKLVAILRRQLIAPPPRVTGCGFKC